MKILRETFVWFQKGESCGPLSAGVCVRVWKIFGHCIGRNELFFIAKESSQQCRSKDEKGRGLKDRGNIK